jgi:hypothetical protein
MKVAILAATLVGFFSAAAEAQYYPNPCQERPPQVPGLLGIIANQMAAQRQAQACAQWRSSEAIRRQSEAAQEQAKQEELQRQQIAEQAAAAAQAQRDAANREHARQAALAAQAAAHAAQIAAENSTDNHCRDQEFARLMIQEFNRFRMMKRVEQEVIDIEHVTTTKLDAEHSDVICHGTFVTTDGLHLTGSLEMRKNIAGDPIILWKADK